MKKKVEFILPFPPSVNQRLSHARKQNRMFLSKTFKNYFKIAEAEINRQIEVKTLTQKVNQIVIFTPPDNRKRDNDNYRKALNDAIKYARIIEDDSLIGDTLIIWKEAQKPGWVRIKLGDFKFIARHENTEVIL